MTKRSFLIFPIILTCYELIVNLSNDMYVPAIVNLMHDLKIDAFQTQMTLTSWFAGTLVVNPLLGIFSDHFGRKKMLILSGIMFVLATTYCGYSNNIDFLLLCRFIQGVSATNVIVCGYALIHELYNTREAVKVIGWMTTALISAPMIGPLLGSIVLLFFDWRFIFYMLAVTATLAIFGIQRYMPKANLQSEQVVLNLRAEILCYLRILSSSRFITASVFAGLFFSGLIAWICCAPFLLISTMHYSPLSFGLMQLPIFGSYILGNLLLNRLLIKDLSIFTLLHQTVGILLALSLCMMAALAILGWSVLLLMIFLSCFSLASGLTSSVLNRMAAEATPYSQGKVMAMFDTILSLSATLISILISQPNFHVLSLFTIIILSITFAIIFVYLLTFRHLRIFNESIQP